MNTFYNLWLWWVNINKSDSWVLNIYHQKGGKKMSFKKVISSMPLFVVISFILILLTTNCAGRTPIIRAAKGGHTEKVRVLIEEGADVNAKDNLGWTALHEAAYSETDIVEVLLDAGIDVNAKDLAGHTALHLVSACSVCNVDVARILLENGADVNLKNFEGRTALHFAAVTGRADVVQILLEAGADADIKDNQGKTALMLAEEGGYDYVTDLLR